MTVKLVTCLAFLLAVFYLGYRGWKETREASDYLLAGRRMGPFIMAMSYAATFISTSAIIGFGGAASLFGFPLLWLTFANVAVGIWLAMVLFGKRTRRMGLALDSHTFAEFLGRRYQSRFIQGFSGLIIFLFIPLYAAAVLIGICRMTEASLGLPFHWGLVVITLLVAVYVITGGLKAVMYTDALQGAVMVLMMSILLVYTYSILGGVVPAHQALTDMAPLMPEKLKAGGMIGWTQGVRFFSPIGLTLYTTIVSGVGIGVLAQPQLAVRFMTVGNDRDLDRAVLYGGIFIPLLPGVAYVVGALSNAVFHQRFGKIAVDLVGGNIDKVIPAYIEMIMPPWFAALFLMAMLAAAMSTMSSQFHVGGSSLGRDVCEQTLGLGRENSIALNKLGVLATIAAALIWAFILPESIIARATAFFFGLCAATFLPVYLLALYWRGMTRAGAVASMLGGFAVSMLWMLFIHEKEAVELGLCQLLLGRPTIVSGAAQGSGAWLLQWVDPNVAALPISLLLALAVSALGRKPEPGHVAHCWQNL
jgi:SSS family solute:Na+ symporter